MSEPGKPQVGTVAWTDLTIPNADEVRDFYAAVAGWKPEALSMGDYNDYVMAAPDGKGVAGVCHARGGNAGLPPQWLIYITVENVDESIRQCLEKGGKVIAGPKKMGSGKYCVIQDPAGAVAALIDSGDKQE
ncbi:MAG TPA: VOC family protein [Thermoanaerobaculia bacterium]|nr:VOC family protein [Thermoanaerobaculia bacterium]